MPNVSDRYFLKDSNGCLTVSVSEAAVRLVLALEARGLALTLDGQDIVIQPSRLLTDIDRAALRQLKPHVAKVLAYTPPAIH
jgi:hypothetical protein